MRFEGPLTPYWMSTPAARRCVGLLSAAAWRGVFFAVLLCGGLAWAGGRTSEAVEKLRETGTVAYQAGNYAAAKQAFDMAFRMAPLHSLGLWAARSRVKLGEWVEAAEQFEKVVKTPVTRGDKAAEERARNEAARERQELRQRMPRVRIRIEGVDPRAVRVQIDGTSVPADYLVVDKKGPFRRGKSLEVNPGEHHVIGLSGEQRRELTVDLTEGQTRDINLRFANPDTIRQRKCRDRCRVDCGDNNSCYVECKRRCFTE